MKGGGEGGGKGGDNCALTLKKTALLGATTNVLVNNQRKQVRAEIFLYLDIRL